MNDGPSRLTGGRKDPLAGASKNSNNSERTDASRARGEAPLQGLASASERGEP